MKIGKRKVDMPCGYEKRVEANLLAVVEQPFQVEQEATKDEVVTVFFPWAVRDLWHDEVRGIFFFLSGPVNATFYALSVRAKATFYALLAQVKEIFFVL